MDLQTIVLSVARHQQYCNQLVNETAAIIGVSPDDYRTAFDKWLSHGPLAREVGLLICKERALHGWPMPWDDSDTPMWGKE